MSLHTLANHMAAQGRNNDSMLVHMTPREVNGLHALAVANGGNLTINPETGLPEAGFLEDLLPAIIGFGLDTFVPGLGDAVGGMFGLSGAAGTGIAVGGLTGLATGSLSKGVMAGFGAYGGAGLADSLMGAGANAATTAGTAGYENMLAEQGLIPGTPEYGAAARDIALNAQKTALAASPMDRLTAGFSATTQNPGALLDFGKNNWKNFVAAGAPLIAGGFSSEGQTVTPMPDNRMITPFVMNQKSVPRDESLSPSAQQRHITYGVTPVTPIHAASGGAVHTFDEGGSVGRDAYGREVGDPDFGKPSDRYEGITLQGGFDRYSNLNGTDAARRAMLNNSPPGGGESFGREPGNTYGSSPGGVTGTDDYTRLLLNAAAPRTFKNTMTGDSAKAFDYLMGYTPDTAKATRVAQVRAPGVAPVAPTTPMPGTTLDPNPHPGGSGSGKSFDDNNTSREPTGYVSNYAPDVNSYTNGFIHALFNPVPNFAPVVDTTGYNSVAEAESAKNQAMAKEYSLYKTLQQVQNENEAANEGAVSTPVTYSPITTSDLPSNDNYSKEGRNSDGFTGSGAAAGSSTSPAAGTTNGGESGGWGSRDAGGDARGGFLNHGKFDQRYAYGGGIAALADGGLGSLGGYSDGGSLLRGPGDGVSDSIPATIGNHQPARLADGEFVVPARIVSELGNGSTEAGARQLYAMMDRIQKGRRKTVGKNKVAANTRAAKHLPA